MSADASAATTAATQLLAQTNVAQTLKVESRDGDVDRKSVV